MQEFSKQSERILAKSQEIQDKASHGEWDTAHLAAALLDNPDGRLKNLFKAKGAKTQEMRLAVQKILDKMPRVVESTDHDNHASSDLASVLRAAVKMVRAEQGSSAEPGHLLVALMKHSGDKQLAAVAKEESALNKFGRELVSMVA